MTPQEREVIDGIFDRLRPAASQPRDPEAERHIAELLRQQPYATYTLAQSVYVQEQALNNLQAEINALKAERDQLQQAQQQQSQQQQSGGFLSGLFGGGAPRPQTPAAAAPGPWSRQGAAEAPAPGPAASPWSRAGAAAQAPAAGGGSGFLGTALTTAAGIAGGMVVGNMLMNAFKGGSDHQQASQPASDFQPFNNRDEAERHASNHDQNAGHDQHHGHEAASYGDDGDFGGDSYDA